MRKAKQILKEMFVGLAAWLFAVLAVLLVVARHKGAAAAGLALGGAAAAGLILHMYRHLDIALDMDARHAQSHAQLSALKRTFVMAAVIAASMALHRYFHPIGTVLGLFGIKAAAYLQPLAHKALGRIGKI